MATLPIALEINVFLCDFFYRYVKCFSKNMIVSILIYVNGYTDFIKVYF